MAPEFRSTADLNPSRFKAHGRADLSIDGRLLVFDAEGPFNLEMVQALRQLVGEFSAGLAAIGPWGQMVRFRGSAMATPEALDALTGVLRLQRELGLAPRGTAYVLPPEVEGTTLMGRPLTRCFEAAGQVFAHFPREVEARAWLAQRLA